ncbi:MAG: SRPBCC family protein [Paracoccaceae bacterium]
MKLCSCYKEDLTPFHYGHYRACEFNSNWKLALENFCGIYHVFKVHPRWTKCRPIRTAI